MSLERSKLYRWNFRFLGYSITRIIFFVILTTIAIFGLFHIFPSFSARLTTTQDRIAIVVLGGGVTDFGDNVPHHTQLRLDKAVKIYQTLKQSDTDILNKQTHKKHIVIITLSGGTPHKPNPRDKHGFPIWESTAAAKKLISMGIPHSDVLEESFSLDTIGNAYFLRTVHIDPGEYSTLYIVTNNWHMDRTKAIFDVVFNLPYSIPIPSYPYQTRTYELIYNPVDAGLEAEIFAVRSMREGRSLKEFNRHTKLQFQSLHELHNWMFTEHSAYSALRYTLESSSSNNLSAEVLKSY